VKKPDAEDVLLVGCGALLVACLLAALAFVAAFGWGIIQLLFRLIERV
jgi:hypothetical protein